MGLLSALCSEGWAGFRKGKRTDKVMGRLGHGLSLQVRRLGKLYGDGDRALLGHEEGVGTLNIRDRKSVV